MTSQVRGQEQLPGATEKSLQASNPARPTIRPPLVEYAALSVTVLADGTWTVRKLSLDKGTNRVLAENLDYGEVLVGGDTTLLSMLHYWAEELISRRGSSTW